MPNRSLRSVLVLAGVLVLSALPALASPVFGPELYSRTSGPADVYNDTFSAPSGGVYVLSVINGDDGGGRVTSGSVTLNGATVVSPAAFQASTGNFIALAVNVAPGTNTLTVTLSDAGSYVTVVILPPYEMGDLSHGRLLLPWAQASNLVLDLKNGSHRHGRRIRMVFYDADGNPVAASDRLHLAPRAALSDTAAALITQGAWSEGSVEIFYCGFGRGRLFGLAVPTDAATGVSSIVDLQHAGFRRLGPS
jgi:hypothetical protein